MDHVSLRARSCTHVADVGTLYDGFDALDLQYGPGYRTLVQGWSSSASALASLRAHVHESTRLHPAELDDSLCLNAAVASTNDSSNETALPFAVDDALLLPMPVKGKLYAVRSPRILAITAIVHPMSPFSTRDVLVCAGGGERQG